MSRWIPSVGVVLMTVGAIHAEDAPAKARTLNLPEKTFRYAEVELPSHFQAARRQDNTPRDNPITDAGATLGRVLFYDTRLSANNTVACASCHKQKHAFSDPIRFSKGYEGKDVDRNSMPLSEARYYPRGRFFWDERAATLEAQVLMPIENKIEMGNDLSKVMVDLGKTSDYPALYKSAFGDSEVTKDRTAKALAQFVRSLVSYESKYDAGIVMVRSRNEDFPNFTREENRGKTTFMQRCANCHLPGQQEAVFLTQNPQNNGLDGDAKVLDLGLADVNFNRFDAGRFKSPSLRNVELTGPYMHDGRFKTLEEVVEHYSTGIKNHPNLDGRLRNAVGGFRFRPEEKAALVAFLKTLSDPKFISDPKFSDPFETK